MRAVSLVLLLLLGGCSVLDSMSSRLAQSNHDPSKIYLGTSTLMIPAKQVGHYACVEQPMVCERFGTDMQCRCLY